MYEVIEQTLKARRTEERYTPMLGLVSILDSMGYEDSLLAATALSSTASDSDILTDDIERLILNNSIHLLKRLGVVISPDVNKEVDFLFAILDWLIVRLDDYSDVDELLDIFNTEEPKEIKLAELTTVFTGRDHYDDIVLIEFIEERFMDFVFNNLTSRKETESSKLKETTPQDIRVGKFMVNLDKTSPVYNEFEAGGYKETRQAFLNTLSINFEEIPFEQRVNAYADLIAGIQVAYVDDYDDAIDVDDILTVVLEDADVALTMRINSLASSKVLEEYYEESE